MAVTDPRFDTSNWEAEAAGDNAVAGPSSSASEDESAERSVESDEDRDDESANGLDEGDDEKVVKGLTPKELEAFERKQRKRGIIYISRIPPGMTVPKVRHLLEGFGQVERMYLHDGRQKAREAETGKKKSRRNTQFTEGWVEMSKKSVAKIVAQTLNAQPIGFSSGGRSANKNARRWKDDVWTMKYLPGFKWHMLNEQMAHERAAHASRLRTELSQSRFEQQDYLKKVERARVQRDKEERKRLRADKAGGDRAVTATTTPSDPAASAPGGKIRTFKQRQPVLRDVRDQRQKSKDGSEPSSSSAKRSRDDTAGSSGPVTKKSKGQGGSSLSGVLSKIF